ncbi:MAG: DUF1573 domain-containing protein [Bacteroidales bacterium]|nr:DUF1573 domain-containing protein [Bacteroidales bacterium]
MINRVLVLLVLATLTGSIAAQPKLQFQETRHDFGTMKEDGGRKTYDFVFKNTGSTALVVTNAIPSCGCTTPDWTKEPVPPGGSGYVRAIFEPMNMPGPFRKTLTIHSNSAPNPVVLIIEGSVTPRELTIEEQYRWALGGLRFESQHLAFTTVKKTEERIKVMPVINTSDKPVTLGFDNLPVHLTMKANPETLKPGQKGIIEGTYDGTKNGGWGSVNDLVRIKIDGVVDNSSFLYVTASLVEDFSSLTSAQLANAPVIKLESDVFDIGKMPVNQTKEVEFKYVNTGKSDLNIRFIRSTCGCTAVQQGKSIIAPGETASIKAIFSSGANPGLQHKNIYVYTNDPNKSEIILTIKGEVVK